VNALGSWWVARACDLVGATMVMLSTDYVFEGVARRSADGSPRPWTEFDPIAPLNAYGRSKAAGEQLVRQALREHHVVRTAWVCGARGGNFVRTMMRVGRERGEARVVDDQVGSPTFTRDLAPALREVAVSGRHGTWNRTNRGACSWYELAAATFELAGLDVDLAPMSSDALERPAPRPAYSVLSDVHATTAGLTPLPHWRDGLRALLAELGDAGVAA
jgi:dTDP-4-dehydrorhamnose reductase